MLDHRAEVQACSQNEMTPKEEEEEEARRRVAVCFLLLLIACPNLGAIIFVLARPRMVIVRSDLSDPP